jgi:ferrous iron transport protein B
MGHTHCHNCTIKIDIPQGAKKIVLAGNPNVGKSVFFNSLTGLYVDVSNYPGTTLEILYGRYGKDIVMDTPGVYGISSFNDEERIARDVILNADLVVNIVDSVHLERDLFLTQQIIDTGVPVIIALNMVDEAEKSGVEVDSDLLSHLLGVPIIETVAVKKKGIDELKEKLYTARKGNINHELQEKLLKYKDRVGCQGEALLILEGDTNVSIRHGIEPGRDREEIYTNRRLIVNDIISHVVKHKRNSDRISHILGKLMIKPLTGIPILLAALYFMYYTIGVFIAGNVVDFLEESIMGEIYIPSITVFVERFINPATAIGEILIGEFGLLTMTVTYIFALLLPLVLGFYLVLSTFEDSGYLPRIAALTDRVMSSIGLNGRAVIPMILGFGCVTLATIVTRVLGTDRERKIAIFLLALAIPCSAQLGVIIGLMAGLPTIMIILYIVTILVVLIIIGTLMDMFLPGKSSHLLIDLPPIRMPRLDNILKKTGTKTYSFIKEAIPIFAFGSFIISILDISGSLGFLQNSFAPITVNWLGLPKEASNAFIMGIMRRDFGAAGLNYIPMTNMQIVIALLVITLFVPCIASLLAIFKERNKKEAVVMWASTFVISFLVGGIVYQGTRLLNAFTENNQFLIIIIIQIGLVLAVTFIAKARKEGKYGFKKDTTTQMS